MKRQLTDHKSTLAGLLITLALLVAPSFIQAQAREQAPAASQAQGRDPELAQKVTLAEGYHDLSLLYLKKGELDMAVSAARQIIQLRFPAEYEKYVAQSLSIITEKFGEIRRYDLGQMLLDEALKAAEQNANRVTILKNKARLYMLAGENDKAIQSWQRALDLEKRIR